MPDTGYCTVEDVRRVLQETVTDFDSGATGEADNRAVVDAITSQTEWLHETTNRHWYEPGGIDGDDHDLVPTEPKTHVEDELDVPSSPHADNAQVQFAAARQVRYPVRRAGPYTRVKLSRRDVVEITELLVREHAGDVTDWVDEHAEGRGEDYYLVVDDSVGFTYLYLHTGTLPRLRTYDGAVTATYEWGNEGLTGTVRRAVAMKVTAQLLASSDEAALGIPENASLVAAETKVQALERQAEELLEVHR